MREDTDLSCREASFSRASFISVDTRNVIISLLPPIRIHCNRKEEKKQLFFRKNYKKPLDKGNKSEYNRIHTNNHKRGQEMKYNNERSYNALIKRGLICEIMRCVIQAYSDDGRVVTGVELPELNRGKIRLLKEVTTYDFV
jgi:hypothetical protein